MRFEIRQTRWGRATYTIHLGEVVIPVRNVSSSKQSPARERMVFAWPDGGECTVRGPNPPVSAIEIVSPEGRIWSGMPVDPQLRKKLERPEVFLWNREDRVITCEAGRLRCRAFFPTPLMLTLRECDGKRLATWFRRPIQRGILQKDLSEDVKPVVLAMVLSSMYNWLD